MSLRYLASEEQNDAGAKAGGFSQKAAKIRHIFYAQAPDTGVFTTVTAVLQKTALFDQAGKMVKPIKGSVIELGEQRFSDFGTKRKQRHVNWM